jgi:hypothetical protein
MVRHSAEFIIYAFGPNLCIDGLYTLVKFNQNLRKRFRESSNYLFWGACEFIFFELEH